MNAEIVKELQGGTSLPTLVIGGLAFVRLRRYSVAG
jgi:hypothetical protein